MKRLFSELLLGCCLLFAACGSNNNSNTHQQAGQGMAKETASGGEVVTRADLESLVSKNKNVIVDFYADWCGPCKQMAPAVENITKQFEGRAVVARINVDKADELCEELGIEAIPYIIFYKDGKIKNELEGYQREEVLQQNAAAIFN